MYSKILYDIDGNILVNEQGRILNVFKPEMDDALKDRHVILYRNSSMGNVCYRYFVTSIEQRDNFLEERTFGTPDGPNKGFHVYVDDDVDRTSAEYKSIFRLSREIS
jgi:hypothetical protein